MIIDNIRNKARYLASHPELESVFAVLESLTEESEIGRYDVSEKAFVNLAKYTNKTEDVCRFEGHAVYADVQYMVKGREVIDVCDGAGETMNEDRLATDDICFYNTPAKYTRVTLHDGDFVLIYPGEAHRPCVGEGNVPCAVVKAVAKIRM